LAIGAAVVCVGLLAAPAGADAATWNGRQLARETLRLPLFGISCPTASLCVAVGGNNTIASSVHPTGGTADWKQINVGLGALPGAPNQRQIRGVSCPSPQLCVAVSFEGLIYTSTDPTGDAAAWSVTDLDASGPNTHFYGISCPTVSFCAASAGDAKVVTSVNPTGGPAAWTTTQLPGPLELRGISCNSTALCVAVGDNGDNINPELGDQAMVAASSAPLLGAWNVVPLPGRQSLFGTSCPSTALCVSGDTLGDLLVATSPTAGTGAWRPIDGGGTVQVTDVDCPSPGLCLAIDNNGDVLTSTNPGGGPGDWTFANVVPYPGVNEGAPNHFFGASCPSRDFCAISANGGQIFTSSDPFVPPAPVVGKDRKKRVRKKGPKRPRVKIALAPPPGVETRARKATVRYRFFARNHASVRRFQCKIDGRPFRRCRSPKTYRVGLGRHVFRVRAIGWSGLKGPITKATPFRVCRPTKYGFCMKRIPPNPQR
jgi:hypothetical protein